MNKKRQSGWLVTAFLLFILAAAPLSAQSNVIPGTDVALIWGIMWHIFENGWEDKEYIRQRVYGMDEIRAEVAKWTPDVVEDVTGVPAAEVKQDIDAIAGLLKEHYKVKAARDGKKALAIAVKNDKPQHRYTRLKDRLAEPAKSSAGLSQHDPRVHELFDLGARKPDIPGRDLWRLAIDRVSVRPAHFA